MDPGFNPSGVLTAEPPAEKKPPGALPEFDTSMTVAEGQVPAQMQLPRGVIESPPLPESPEGFNPNGKLESAEEYLPKKAAEELAQNAEDDDAFPLTNAEKFDRMMLVQKGKGWRTRTGEAAGSFTWDKLMNATKEMVGSVGKSYADYAKKASQDNPLLVGPKAARDIVAGGAIGVNELGPVVAGALAQSPQAGIGQAIGMFSPKAEQYFDAALNVGAHNARLWANKNRKRILKATGAEENFMTGLGEFGVPIGFGGPAFKAAGQVAETIGKAAPRVATGVAGGVYRGIAKSAPAIGRAASIAARGGAGFAAGETVGHGPLFSLITLALSKGKNAVADATTGMIKTKFTELADDAATMAGARGNQSMIEALVQKTDAGVADLRAKAQGLLASLPENEVKAVMDQLPSGNGFLIDAENLGSDAAKAARRFIEESNDAERKANMLRQRMRSAKTTEDIERFVASTAGHVGIGAATGAAFPALASPVGDTESWIHGVPIGGALSLGISGLRVPTAMKDSRLSTARMELKDTGTQWLRKTNPEALEQLKALPERDRDDFLTHVGNLQHLGTRFELVTPERMAAVTGGNNWGVFYDHDGDGLIMLDQTRLGEGVANHETWHAFEKAYAFHESMEGLRMAEEFLNPSTPANQAASDKFKAKLAKARGVTPESLSPETLASEAAAEVARLVGHAAPVEYFYGGKGLGEKFADWVNRAADFVDPDYTAKVPGYDAPFAAEDVKAVKDVKFRAGLGARRAREAALRQPFKPTPLEMPKPAPEGAPRPAPEGEPKPMAAPEGERWTPVEQDTGLWAVYDKSGAERGYLWDRGNAIAGEKHEGFDVLSEWNPDAWDVPHESPGPGQIIGTAKTKQEAIQKLKEASGITESIMESGGLGKPLRIAPDDAFPENFRPGKGVFYGGEILTVGGTGTADGVRYIRLKNRDYPDAKIWVPADELASAPGGPGQPMAAPNLPNSSKDRLTGPAIQLRDGMIIRGYTFDAAIKEADRMGLDVTGAKVGFTTNLGRWLPQENDAALNWGQEIGQLPADMTQLTDFDFHAATGAQMKKGGKPMAAPEDELQRLRPALRTEAGVIEGQPGQTHKDIYAAQPDPVELRASDPEHGFVDPEGNFHTREEAAAMVGETTPLQSERLNELRGGKAMAVPEDAARLPSTEELLRNETALGNAPEWTKILGRDRYWMAAEPEYGSVNELFGSLGEARDYMSTMAGRGEVLIARTKGQPDRVVKRIPHDPLSENLANVARAGGREAYFENRGRLSEVRGNQEPAGARPAAAPGGAPLSGAEAPRLREEQGPLGGLRMAAPETGEPERGPLARIASSEIPVRGQLELVGRVKRSASGGSGIESFDEFTAQANRGKVHQATGERLPGEDMAESPYEIGKINKYSEDDIAAFYTRRRGGNHEIAYQEYADDKAKYLRKKAPMTMMFDRWLRDVRDLNYNELTRDQYDALTDEYNTLYTSGQLPSAPAGEPFARADIERLRAGAQRKGDVQVLPPEGLFSDTYYSGDRHLGDIDEQPDGQFLVHGGAIGEKGRLFPTKEEAEAFLEDFSPPPFKEEKRLNVVRDLSNVTPEEKEAAILKANPVLSSPNFRHDMNKWSFFEAQGLKAGLEPGSRELARFISSKLTRPTGRQVSFDDATFYEFSDGTWQDNLDRTKVDMAFENEAQLRESLRGAEIEDRLEGKPMAAPEGLSGVTPGPAKDLDQLGFYSPLRRAIQNKMPNKASADQVRAIISQGVKKDEIAWTGFDDFLAKNPNPTKQEALNFLARNNVKIMEEVIGEGGEIPYVVTDDGEVVRRARNEDEAYDEATDYVDTYGDGRDFRRLVQTSIDPDFETRVEYQLPGESSGYREVVLWTPRIAPFAEQDALHFGDVGGGRALGWARVNDRVTPDGEKMLFIEEVQSKRHQAGREYGYNETDWSPAPTPREVQEARKLRTNFRDLTDLQAARLRHLEDKIRKSNLPPDAPFKATWPELVMKRMIRLAAEQGYDRIGWTTGEQQAERYDLSKQISKVEWQEADQRLLAYDHHGEEVIHEEGVKAEDLHKYIGKEAAQTLSESTPQPSTEFWSSEDVWVKSQPWLRQDGYWDSIEGATKHAIDVLGMSEAEAKKLVEETNYAATAPADTRKLEGVDLKVGGEGMKTFYDKMLRSIAENLGKKFGSKVDTVELPQPLNAAKAEPGESRPFASIDKEMPSGPPAVVHSMKITPEMRASVKESGHPLFMAAPEEGSLGPRRANIGWPADFPPVTIHTSVGALKKHPEYRAAKTGDPVAAAATIDDVVNPERLKELAQKYPDAIVVAVHAEEAAGRNQLPLAYANAFHGEGLDVDTDIVQSNRTFHTGATALDRLLTKPEFAGEVQKRNYIVVDDVATSGSTLQGLREYIESNGGKVVAATSLATTSSPQTGYGGYLALTPEVRATLVKKFGEKELGVLLSRYGLGLEGLTNSQAKYISSYGSLEALGNRLAAAEQERVARENAEFQGEEAGAVETPAGLASVTRPRPMAAPEGTAAPDEGPLSRTQPPRLAKATPEDVAGARDIEEPPYMRRYEELIEKDELTPEERAEWKELDEQIAREHGSYQDYLEQAAQRDPETRAARDYFRDLGPPLKFMAAPDEPRAIRAAAIKFDDGRVFEGVMHFDALMKAVEHYGEDYAKLHGKYTTGYATNSDEYLTREAAKERAIEVKQITPKGYAKADAAVGGDLLQGGRGLESLTFAKSRKFMAAPEDAESPRRRIQAVDEEGRPLLVDKDGIEIPDEVERHHGESGKYTWQQTLPEFQKTFIEGVDRNLARRGAAPSGFKLEDVPSDLWRMYVQSAMTKGKPVPPEVVEQYKNSGERPGGKPMAAPPSHDAIDIMEGKLVPGDEDVSRTGPQGRRSMFDAVKFLSRRAARKGRLDEHTPENMKAHAEVMLREAQHALSKDGNALGWYDRQFKRALKRLAEVHPEIGTGSPKDAVFKAILAITSNGQDVRSNFNRAVKLFGQYKETGLIDTTPWGGKVAQQISSGLETLQDMIRERGEAGTQAFLEAPITVRELKELGHPIAGEGVDTTLRGAYMFGPKLGSFYGNLNGDFSTTTMDRWFMRTFNRQRGTLTEMKTGKLPKQLQRLLDATAGRRKYQDMALAPVREQAARVLREIKKGTFNAEAFQDEVGPLQEFVRKTHQAFARDKFNDRSEINMSAKNVDLNIRTLREAPAGARERNWVRKVMAETQRLLKEQGVEINSADLQALMWYFEKDLHGKLYKQVKRGSSADYATAADELVDAIQAGKEIDDAPRTNEDDIDIDFYEDDSD